MFQQQWLEQPEKSPPEGNQHVTTLAMDFTPDDRVLAVQVWTPGPPVRLAVWDADGRRTALVTLPDSRVAASGPPRWEIRPLPDRDDALLVEWPWIGAAPVRWRVRGLSGTPTVTLERDSVPAGFDGQPNPHGGPWFGRNREGRPAIWTPGATAPTVLAPFAGACVDALPDDRFLGPDPAGRGLPPPARGPGLGRRRGARPGGGRRRPGAGALQGRRRGLAALVPREPDPGVAARADRRPGRSALRDVLVGAHRFRAVGPAPGDPAPALRAAARPLDGAPERHADRPGTPIRLVPVPGPGGVDHVLVSVVLVRPDGRRVPLPPIPIPGVVRPPAPLTDPPPPPRPDRLTLPEDVRARIARGAAALFVHLAPARAKDPEEALAREILAALDPLAGP